MTWSVTLVTRSASQAAARVGATILKSIPPETPSDLKNTLELMAANATALTLELALPLEELRKIISVSAYGHLTGGDQGGSLHIAVTPGSVEELELAEGKS